MVNEFNNIFLKGINDKITTTMGKTCITLLMNNKIIKTHFHVVDSDFLIPKDGLLGIKFLADNEAVIDIANNKLIVPDETVNEVNDRTTCLTL